MKPEEKWRSLIENVPDIITVSDRDGTIQFINHTVSGMTPEQVIGKKLYDYISPEYHETAKKLIEQVFQTGVGSDYELIGAGPDGTSSWYWSRIGPVKHDGQVVAASIITRDITERKKAEKEIKETTDKLQTIFENITDMVAYVDKYGKILDVNERVQDLLGYKPSEVIGKHFSKLGIVRLKDTPKIVKLFRDTVKSGKPSTPIELTINHKDGSSIDVEVFTRFIKKDGKAERIVSIFRNITDRKKAEEEIKRLGLAVEQSTDGIAIGDSEPKLIYVNRAYAEMHGYSREEMIGMKVADLHNEEQIEEYKKDIAKVKTKGFWLGEISHIRKDGTTFPTYMSVTLLKNDKGKPNGILAIARNITERKKTEEMAKESEQRFRYIFDNAADGIVLANVESRRFHTCNKKFCEMLGYSEEEIKNIGVADIHPKEYLPHIIDQFERQTQGEFTLTKDSPVKKKDDSVFYADINAIPMTLEGNRYLLGIFRDVTGRKLAEEALRQSEVKYRTLLENLPQKIFLKDKNSVYISCNENYAADLKIKAEEIAGKTDYDFYPRELAEKYRADDKKIIESGQTKDIEETYIKYGQEVIVHTIKTPVRDEQENVIGILGIFRDITRQKQTEEELDMYREKMTRAEQLASLGTLSATVAHELTQPLTVISLAIENSLAELKKKSCPDSMMQDLKKGLSEVSHATSIVNRFRNFARESPDKAISKTDLKVIAERIKNLLNERARRAKVTLEVKEIGKLPPIYANEKDMEQLFFTLVDNAIQSADGKNNHKLIINGKFRDNYVELRFSDNCGGIAPENIDRIFEPFFSTRPQGEGTGLGLCIVQRIVSRAGGKICVESKIGEGSTFLVTLPINSSERF